MEELSNNMQDGFLGKTLVLMKILVKINDIYGNQSETGLLSTHSGLPQYKPWETKKL